MTNYEDRAFMSLAYSLAEKALGRASPNPYVGAVIVKKKEIVGYGFHEGAGMPHAEIVALQRAGSRGKNSTVYVTLEPCVHWGRTPPCIDSILNVQPKRVVVSALDPNPLVYRKGIGRMRRAGIEVSVGLLEERNRRLNEHYLKYITAKFPFVTLKAALSLDAKMATKNHDSRWMSSTQTRDYVHLLRGEYDGLMVGINTILKDDPRLTVRHAQWKGKKIMRIILDSALRLSPRARILSTLAQGRIIVFSGPRALWTKRAVLEKKGVEVVCLPGAGPKLDLHQVLLQLGKREITSVLVEGGGRLATDLLERKLADKIFLTMSPLLVGGEKAVSFFGGEGAAALKDALRLRKLSFFRLGKDLILEGYF